MKKPTSEVKKVAKALLGALKRKWPETNFRVIPHSVDVHINVMWSKGPTYEAVKEISQRYEKRIKYIVHARGYGDGTDFKNHQNFIEQVARDICTLKGKEYQGRWDDAKASRILSYKDLTQGYKGITLEDLSL